MGFSGSRGLSKAGIDFYEADSAQSYKPEPPHGTHAQLLAQAKAWVTLMGGEFRGDAGCGCVESHYAIEVDSSVDYDWAIKDATFRGAGKTQGRIPLTLAGDGSFTGRAQTARTMIGSSYATGASSGGKLAACNWQRQTTTSWLVEGALDEKSQQLRLTLKFQDSREPFAINCNSGPAIAQGDLYATYSSQTMPGPWTGIVLPTFLDEEKTRVAPNAALFKNHTIKLRIVRAE